MATSADTIPGVQDQRGKTVSETIADDESDDLVREPGKPRWHDFLSIRTRVLAAVSLLSLLSLILAGVVAFSLERRRIDADVASSLQRRHQEFTSIVERKVNPATGQAFTSLRDLLAAALQNTLPDDTEGEIGIIDDRLAWKAATPVPVRLENDPMLMRELFAVARSERVVRATIKTPISTYTYIVIPVKFEGDPSRGAFALAYDLEKEHRKLYDTYGTYALVGLATLVLIGLVAWLIIGRLLEPVAWVRATAQDISDTDLSRRIPVRGNDDLAQLTVTVNDMLDRLEKTFADQRQLYDDVGHELRTPLTVLRGHLELCDFSDAGEAEVTRALALSEIHRMGRLVEDLLTLAKAGRPDFLSLEEVDVAMVTDETLEKATTLGKRRWVLDQMAEVTAVADHQRIVQALLELSRNAVKFSEIGTTVALGSSSDGEWVRLWVRDEGVGIPADRIDDVRQRFVRNASKKVDGSGLGLAIVSSIAEAHRGYLDIQSQPGQGSTITLVLPLRQEHDHEPDPDR